MENISINFLLGDACKMPVKSNSVDLIITSPPYSGIDPYRYGGNHKDQINSDSKNMLNLLIKSAKEMERVIKDSGSIMINIGNNDSMPYLFISEIIKKTNLKLVGPPIIITNKDMSKYYERNIFNSSYGFWFHLSKNTSKIKYHKLISKKYNDPFWDLPWNENTDVFNKLMETDFVLDSYNSEIARRFIKIFTNPGDTVLDPFGGSGVTAIQAYIGGRNGTSIDISPVQTELAKKRFSMEIEYIRLKMPKQSDTI